MADSPKPEEFKFSPDDALADEHAAVRTWVEEAFATLDTHYFHKQVDLKTQKSGQKLLDGTPEQRRRYLLAAVAQVRHWEQVSERFCARGTTEIERKYPHFRPGWGRLWGRREQAAAAVNALMRRSLPLEKHDLVEILRWCNDGGGIGAWQLSTVLFPIGYITRALERHASESPLDFELRDAMRHFAARLRDSNDKEAKGLGTSVEQLCVDAAAVTAADPAAPDKSVPTPVPAPAGCAGILTQLKMFRGMIPADTAPRATLTEPDRFALSEDSPLRSEHELLSAMFEEVIGTAEYNRPSLNGLKAGRVLLAPGPADRWKVIMAAAERHINAVPHTFGRSRHDTGLAIALDGGSNRGATLEISLRDGTRRLL